MRKIHVAVLTACVLFCLSASLPAQNVDIVFTVDANGINMGENSHKDVQPNDKITWICNSPFAVIFDEDAPFTDEKPASPAAGDKRHRKVKLVNADAVAYSHYKYSIAVWFNNEVVTLDPVIIIIPPKH